MSKEAFLLCDPVPFKKGIQVYPPKLKEVINNPHYGLYIKILTQSQEEVEDEFVKEKKSLNSFPTPFEFLLNNSYHYKNYEALAKEAFQFFIKQKVTFLYEEKLVIVGDLQEIVPNLKSLDQLVVITEKEFFDFQNLVRESIGTKPVEPPNPNEHPRIKAMKAKARYRDKVKAKQNQKNGISLYTVIVSICCMGLGINPLNIGEMSYIAVNSIFNMYQNKEKYELDVDTLLAGGDSKKIKPKYWIRNFEE